MLQQFSKRIGIRYSDSNSPSWHARRSLLSYQSFTTIKDKDGAWEQWSWKPRAGAGGREPSRVGSSSRGFHVMFGVLQRLRRPPRGTERGTQVPEIRSPQSLGRATPLAHAFRWPDDASPKPPPPPT